MLEVGLMGHLGNQSSISTRHLTCLEAIPKPDGTLVSTVSLNDSSPPLSINAAAEKPGKICMLGTNLPQVIQQHAQARGWLEILGRAFPGSSWTQRPQLTSEISTRSRRQFSLSNKPLNSPMSSTCWKAMSKLLARHSKALSSLQGGASC